MSAFRVLMGVVPARGSTSRPPRPIHRRPASDAIVAALVVGLLAGPVSAAAAASLPREKAAVGYLASQQRPNGAIPAFSAIGSTADAIVSMVAVRTGKGAVTKALAYLERQVLRGNVSGVGLTAKVVMAVEAAKGDARDFGGENLIGAIRSTLRPDGRYGVSTPVFDQALAILALRAVGRPPSAGAFAWLADAQCDDGGWAFDEPAAGTDDEHCVDEGDPGSDFFASDTNTSSLAVQALGQEHLSEADHDPIGFFDVLRDETFGGWGYTFGFETTDTNSTALVMQAYAAADADEPAGVGGALKDLQYRACGAWAYTWVDDGEGGFERSAPNVGATIGGILGLKRISLPVPAAAVSKLEPAPNTPACPM